MIINRRALFGVAAGAANAVANSSLFAQDHFPSRTVTFVCAFGPGSGADIIVRYFAQKIAEITKATIIVENKAGAAGNIAAEYVVRSKPDGYTVYVHGGNTVAANMHLFNKPPFDATADLRVAATINLQPYMLMVLPDHPAKSVGELTEIIKKKGDGASYAVSNTAARVMGALYKQSAGLQAVEVSYRDASESMNDMLSGRIDYALHDPVFALSQSRNGRLRMLAVSTAKRMKSLPNVPTMSEQGAGNIDLFGWWAAMLPAKTPDNIVNTWNELFGKALALDETVKFLNDFGTDVLTMTPAEAQEFMKRSVRDWEGYVRLANIPKN